MNGPFSKLFLKIGGIKALLGCCVLSFSVCFSSLLDKIKNFTLWEGIEAWLLCSACLFEACLNGSKLSGSAVMHSDNDLFSEVVCCSRVSVVSRVHLIPTCPGQRENYHWSGSGVVAVWYGRVAGVGWKKR